MRFLAPSVREHQPGNHRVCSFEQILSEPILIIAGGGGRRTKWSTRWLQSSRLRNNPFKSLIDPSMRRRRHSLAKPSTKLVETATPPRAEWPGLFIPRRRRLFSSRRFSISFAAWFRTRQSSFHVAWPSLLRAISAAQARSSSTTVSAIGCLSPLLRHSDSVAGKSATKARTSRPKL
jgi:hypothetical protein